MEEKFVDTENNKKDGVNRCPQCGAGNIIYDINKQKLVCDYCGIEYNSSELEGIETEARNLNNEVRTSGTKDIKDINEVITLKCSGCGAEVVINTKESLNARCHWCRSILSINSQIENGSVPDFVLPFKLKKEDAQKSIEEFVEKRRFFANREFKKEFTTNNIMGAYFPYLLIDANCHAFFSGEGGHIARTYTIVTGTDENGNKETETVYDIDVHHVERDFDIAIDDLSIESSKDKLDKKNKSKTTNVINAIMPFDTENCVKYEPNYLVGYTSEKRDINVDELKEKVNQSLKDVARHSINSNLKYYNAGVNWKEEKFDIKGQQWTSSYLPVWLYSYQDSKKILHYVAVNGRTGETMGSIPMNKLKLVLMSILIFILAFIIPILVVALISGNNIGDLFTVPAMVYASFVIGFAFSLSFYFRKKTKYLNKDKRHAYEKETQNSITNIKTNDYKIKTLEEESFPKLRGANNNKIVGEYTNIKNESQVKE